ncbi:hypothetical protein HN592_02470 [Candidatus Woesearchaeota archaeon]|jgi:hypothetical protein|nr:hypothetical protein [Candidatus Woesearchaeota archaeon]MBT4368076.1 hypothetical protein [Candidatus Woesearchaeota archaeon]MBT4712564.1 hypothetical protein [Candidatus Woesearchaeota archaeon]MBT6639477.1 hypothetical protein [Candidatus Woesearchaeota archaeon]MBT7133649.1 hypothetical protein [Candidatus Woesearchaeota archaeon]
MANTKFDPERARQLKLKLERSVDRDTVLGSPVVAVVNLKSALKQRLPNHEMAQLFITEYITDPRFRSDALRIAEAYGIQVPKEESVVIPRGVNLCVAEATANASSGEVGRRMMGYLSEYRDPNEENWARENSMG